MIRYVTTLLLAFSAVTLGASGSISKVNSSIRVDDGGQAGDVSTVNGSITIGRNASVREVDFYLGNGVEVGPVEGVEPRRYRIAAADAG